VQYRTLDINLGRIHWAFSTKFGVGEGVISVKFEMSIFTRFRDRKRDHKFSKLTTWPRPLPFKGQFIFRWLVLATLCIDATYEYEVSSTPACSESNHFGGRTHGQKHGTTHAYRVQKQYSSPLGNKWRLAPRRPLHDAATWRI